MTRTRRRVAGSATVETAIISAALLAILLAGPGNLAAALRAALDRAVDRFVAAVGAPLP